jgi:hypothetical protein
MLCDAAPMLWYVVRGTYNIPTGSTPLRTLGYMVLCAADLMLCDAVPKLCDAVPVLCDAVPVLCNAVPMLCDAITVLCNAMRGMHLEHLHLLVPRVGVQDTLELQHLDDVSHTYL